MLAASLSTWSLAGLLVLVVLTAGWFLVIALRRARRAQRELAGWRLLEEHLPIALVRTNGEGRVVGWNPAAAHAFGYSAAEMLGASAELLDGGEVAGLRSAMEQAGLGGHGCEPWTGAVAVRGKDGALVPCESLILNLAQEGGGSRQVGMHLDTSRLRAEESARRLLEEQLQQSQRMHAVGQLAGGIAHDFNNLLTSILGYAEILARHFEPGSEERDDLAELEKAGRRAAALTRQLLSFSRQQTARASTVNVVTIVDGLTQLLSPTLGEGVTVEVEHDGESAWVLADRSEIEQVVMNLALNGRDAMPRGGALRLSTGRVRLPIAELSEPHGLPPGEYVELVVSDEGQGMAAETGARIFEPFFTTKERGKGTGLGLSTVQSIVRRCGGVIEVESVQGEGSRFRVLLPSVEPEAAVPGTQPVPRSAPGMATVLVVEDEPLVRRLVCSGLREAGYVVLEASSGSEARDLAQAHDGSIELLIADVVMPGEGGVQVAEALTAQRPDMRVLYISGYTEDAILAHGVPVQSGAFLQKPFTPASLQARLQTLLAAGTSVQPVSIGVDSGGRVHPVQRG